MALLAFPMVCEDETYPSAKPECCKKEKPLFPGDEGCRTKRLQVLASVWTARIPDRKTFGNNSTKGKHSMKT